MLRDDISIRTTCAECGTPLSGLNLNRRGDLFYCSADFQRLSPEEALENHLLEVELEHYKLMFDGSAIDEGLELVTNGGFDSDTEWDNTGSPGAGIWSIANGVASADGTQSFAITISQTGKTRLTREKYKYTFTVSDYTAGSIRVNQSASYFGTVRSANGTYIETLSQLFNSNLIRLTADSDFDGSIDNFSITQVAI